MKLFFVLCTVMCFQWETSGFSLQQMKSELHALNSNSVQFRCIYIAGLYWLYWFTIFLFTFKTKKVNWTSRQFYKKINVVMLPQYYWDVFQYVCKIHLFYLFFVLMLWTTATSVVLQVSFDNFIFTWKEKGGKVLHFMVFIKADSEESVRIYNSSLFGLLKAFKRWSDIKQSHTDEHARTPRKHC